MVARKDVLWYNVPMDLFRLEKKDRYVPMRKKIKLLGLVLALGLVFAGCGEKEEAVETVDQVEQEVQEETKEEETFDTEAERIEGEVSEEETVTEEEAAPVPEEEEEREGYFRSEITNEWIEERLWGQRPIAVMVDNEKIALPHYGLTQADVVYELMNSTANDRITRFMCIVKDWQSITQFGSIRSVRTTNLQLLAEWNAVLCHDGGPAIYITPYLQNPYVENFS